MPFVTRPPLSGAIGPSAIDTPSDIANIWDWWEPSREGLGNDADINTLNGQFANKDFGKGSGLAPTNKTNILNGLSIARFDGVNQYMDAGPDPSALTAFHAFLVVKSPTSESGLWTLQTTSGAGTKTLYPGLDGNLYEGAARTARINMGTPVLSITTFRVYEIISTSSEWTCKIDGTQQHTTGTNTVSLPSTALLGISSDHGVDFSRFGGDIAGMYWFSAKLTSGQRSQEIGYINNRFGLSSS